MEIYVCIKQVPDTETKIKISSDGSTIDLAGTKWVMNPYDEFAVEEALKIKAANAGSLVHVITVGSKNSADALRTALAMGADEAVLIETSESLDNLVVAQALGRYLKTKKADLILAGKAAIDDNSMAVPQMLAHEISVPHVTVVSKLDVQAGKAIAEREVEGGAKEIIEVILPAVIAANKGLNTPRYASLPGIMKAKKKAIQEVALSSLELSASQNKVKLGQFQLPPERPTCKMLTGDPAQQSSELVKLLREEAKII